MNLNPEQLRTLHRLEAIGSLRSLADALDRIAEIVIDSAVVSQSARIEGPDDPALDDLLVRAGDLAKRVSMLAQHATDTANEMRVSKVAALTIDQVLEGSGS